MRKLHRSFFVLKMSSHFNTLTEAFDKPYKYRLRKKNDSFWIGDFNLPDGGDIVVYFEGLEWSDTEKSWAVKFQRTNPSRPHASLDVTGEGDAMRVFATVIDVLKDFTKKEKPQELAFGAWKSSSQLNLPKGHPKTKELSSREKLYKKLVQRYADRMGYKYTTQTDDMATVFRLVRK